MDERRTGEYRTGVVVKELALSEELRNKHGEIRFREKPLMARTRIIAQQTRVLKINAGGTSNSRIKETKNRINAQ